MPVSVNIPTRIRVDPDALFTRRGCIEEALAAAATRALKNSKEVVLAKRGGYVEVELYLPEVTWSGDGLAAVPTALRGQIEQRLAAILGQAARGAGIFDFTGAAERAPATLPDEISEPVGIGRYATMLGIYTVSSLYDGKRVPVPVITDEPPIITTTPEEGEWWQVETVEDFRAAVEDALSDRGIEPPASGYFGVIYRGPDGKIRAAIIKNPGGEVPLVKDLSSLGKAKLDAGTRRLSMDPVELPTHGTYQLSWFARGRNLQERLDAYKLFYGPFLRSRLAHDSSKVANAMDIDQTSTAIETRISELLRPLARAVPQGVTSFLRLDTGVGSYLLWTAVDLGSDFQIELIPLADLGRARRVVRGEGREAKGRPEVPLIAERPAAAPQGCFQFDVFNTSNEDQYCSAFRGEPSLNDLGDYGKGLRELMGQIAAKLQIDPCEYAGRFCIRAYEAISRQASDVGSRAATANMAGLLQPTSAGKGNFKNVQFNPTSSPHIRALRTLASVTPLLTVLSQAVDGLYDLIGRGNRPDCPSNATSWEHHFAIDLTDVVREAVGNIFEAACRILLLQLLYASRKSIQDRIGRIDNITETFRLIVLRQLETISDLMALRDRLQQAIAEAVQLAPYAYYTNWPQAHGGVSAAASGQAPGPQDDIVRTDGRITGIRDQEGRVWTQESLEAAIALRRGVAEEVDPVVKQILDLPDVIARVRANPTSLKDELLNVLNTMVGHNAEFISKTQGSSTSAFRMGRISETYEGATVSGAPYALQGIHLIAHQAVGDAFAGDWSYAEGIRFLFGAELGFEALTSFGELAGIVLLSIVCPPLGFVAGVASAAYHYVEARERGRFYGALLNPEVFLSHAEVEAELFAAKLGLVLAFVPESVSIVRAGIKGVKAVAEEGLVAGARTAARAAARHAMEEMAERLAQGVVEAFARELATAEFLNQFLSLFLEPLIEQVEREASFTGPVGGLAEAAGVLRRLQKERGTLGPVPQSIAGGAGE